MSLAVSDDAAESPPDPETLRVELKVLSPLQAHNVHDILPDDDSIAAAQVRPRREPRQKNKSKKSRRGAGRSIPVVDGGRSSLHAEGKGEGNPDGAPGVKDDQDVELQSRPVLDQQWSHTSQPDALRDPEFLDLLRGSARVLPQIQSNTVRIFLSSTFSDFKAERNFLPRQAYPELQTFCSQRGLDFQVVDMRWGVTDELINDHQVSELCIREIQTCQQVSCGPNFVVLLGDRYGFRPFPARIPAEEYLVLYSMAEKCNMTGTDILQEWYMRDDNAIPVEYVLQPIASKLPYYNDLSDEHQVDRKKDKETWDVISGSIQELLRAAVTVARDEGLVSDLAVERYFISVTEEEIQAGLLRTSSAPNTALCYKRELQGVDNPSQGGNRHKFTDLVGDEVDSEARKLRTVLADDKIPKALGPEGLVQMKNYVIPWQGINLEESQEKDHVSYLEKFSADFVSDMKAMVNKKLAQEAGLNDARAKILYNTILHHAHFARKKCEIFCGRQEAISSVKTMVQSSEDRPKPPIIISGTSGMGKTALMAYIGTNIKLWFDDLQEVNVIMRYLGTSPESSNVLDTLRSVIHHICALYQWSPPADDKLSKVGEVRRFFVQLLSRIQEQFADTRLVILLDSVDQLMDTLGAHVLTWLPKVLPKCVYVIVSMLSDRYSCLANAKTRYPDMDFYVDLQPMSKSNGEELVKSYMSSHSRTLTKDQKLFVLDLFARCCNPLFLKLTLDLAVRWHSYEPPSQLDIQPTVHAAIVKLFEDLELKFGHVFVRRALGYLSCGRVGLTGLEMEDILSCDDDVLNEVYKYHDPPLEGTVRVPSLLWARLADAMTEYLTQRQVDGKHVLAWYHRQFWETAEEWNLPNVEAKAFFHQRLAELYQQEQGIRRTVVLHQRQDRVWKDADRRVTPQPLIVRNIRKLNSLPHHLLHAGDVITLKRKCLLNFRFLYTKVEAVGIGSVFSEYKQMTMTDPLASDADVCLVRDLLEISYDAIAMYTPLLAFNICERMGRMRTLTPLCRDLVDQATEWLSRTESPLMVPTHPLKFPGLDSALKFTVLAGYDGVMSSDDKILVCSLAHKTVNAATIHVLHLPTKDLLAAIPVAKATPLQLTRDNAHFLYTDKLSLKKCEVESGDLVREVLCTDEAIEAVTPRCLAVSCSGRYAATGLRLGKPKTEQETWKIRSIISVIDLDDVNASVHTVEYQGRKHLDTLDFVAEDTKLVASGRARIYIYSVPTLQELACVDNVFVIQSDTMQVIPNTDHIAVVTCPSQRANILFYNYLTAEHRYVTGTQYEEAEGPVTGFGLKVKDDMSMGVMGTALQKENKGNRLVLWTANDDGTRESAISLGLGLGSWKSAKSMVVSEDWSIVVVGWNNGDMSIVTLPNLKEVRSFRAHSNNVSFLRFFAQGTKLASLGYDNHLKVWDTEQLVSEAAVSISIVEEDMDDIVEEDVTNTTVEKVQQENLHQATAVAAESNGQDEIIVSFITADTNDMGTTDIKTQTATPDAKGTVSTDIKGSTGAADAHDTGTKDIQEPTAAAEAHDTGSTDIQEPTAAAEAHDTGPKDIQEPTAAADVNETKKPDGVTDPNTKADNNEYSNCRMLDPDEQCIAVACCNDYVITADHLNIHGPQFWRLSDGVLHSTLTAAHQRLYWDALKSLNFKTQSRMHATVNVFDGLIAYVRKKRSSLYIYLVRDWQAASDTKIMECDNTFHVLLPAKDAMKSSQWAENDREVLLVRDGVLEIRDVNLDLKKSISFPKISDDVTNFESNNGKKKLMNYKFGVTYDRRYALVINLSLSRTKKWFDLIDLKAEKFIRRVPIDKSVSWNITVLDDSFYILAQLPGKKDMCLYPPSKLPQTDTPNTYQSLIFCEKNLLSEDLSLGVEFFHGKAIRLWRTEPLSRLHTLDGHLAEILCTQFSGDNSLLVSGSNDHTVRVWSVEEGTQLTVFHMYGAVSHVALTPDGRHVVVNCYAAPQRKRAAILQLRNIVTKSTRT